MFPPPGAAFDALRRVRLEDSNNRPSRDSSSNNSESNLSLFTRLKRILIGPPRDLADRSLHYRISLVAFLAWVGLGADGLSSSAYGPEEAFRHLGGHTYLALALAVLMALTVFIISTAYSRIIELFPHGGGGYVVASKLLGKRVGVVSGSALLVDYVLTITISIAAAGDAIFSLLPIEWHIWKLPAEVFLIFFLIILNLRGVRESILVMAPIFFLFLLTHLVLIAGGIISHAPLLPATLSTAQSDFGTGLQLLGWGGLFLIFIHAYSLGGGTYTGIESIANSVANMREPRVQTAKRTIVYSAASLAFTACGLLLCYLLWDAAAVEGKTMNAVLVEKIVTEVPLGAAFVIITLISEGALLIVAALAGFVAGPRVLANMANDSWVPRRFAALSDRLTTQNGIVLMGLAALAALLYTNGQVRIIVVMYSINVFLTFSLSMLAMLRHTWRSRASGEFKTSRLTLFLVGFLLCATILIITTIEKFTHGGWLTLAVTGAVIIFCFMIKRHYEGINGKLNQFYKKLMDIPRSSSPATGEPDPKNWTAGVLVAGYGGLGLHTVLNIFREFPNHYKGIVFISVGVIDSREFKGEGTIENLKSSVEENLKKYVEFCRGQGVPATYRMDIGTDAVAEAEKLCMDVAKEFPRITFFVGKVLFEKEKWFQRILHNETAFAIQKRLQWDGKTVVVVPARIS